MLERNTGSFGIQNAMGPLGPIIPTTIVPTKQPTQNPENFLKLEDVLIEATITLKQQLNKNNMDDTCMGLFIALQPQILKKIKLNLEERKIDDRFEVRCRLGVISMKNIAK